MITLLTKLFIKNPENVTDPKVRQAYGTLAGGFGIFLNIILFVGKFLVGALSNSIAITADAFNNLSDAGSSVVTLLGFKLASKKPNSKHPFGHGRLEYVSGLIVSAAILLMAYELVKASVEKILYPEAVEFNIVAIVILIASIAVKGYMSVYNRSIGNKINSAAMKATATDSLSDSIATLVVLIASLISYFFGVQIDGWAGILVGLFIFYAGFNAAKETLSPLLGQPPEPEFVESVEELVMANENIVGVHDLVVHDYGPGRVMISLHAEVPAEGDVLELHDMIDNLEYTLMTELNCAATIHMDPVVTTDPRVDALKAQTLAVIKEIDDIITMHDFRVVLGPTHNNLIFDVVVPFKYKMSDEELRERIQKDVFEKLEGNNFAIVTIDKSYVEI